MAWRSMRPSCSTCGWPAPAGPVYGKLLSADGHFIHFEMDLDDNLRPLPGSVAWDDISARYDLAAHKRGTGVGYGELCKQVLQELNQDGRQVPRASSHQATRTTT